MIKLNVSLGCRWDMFDDSKDPVNACMCGWYALASVMVRHVQWTIVFGISLVDVSCYFFFNHWIEVIQLSEEMVAIKECGTYSHSSSV